MTSQRSAPIPRTSTSWPTLGIHATSSNASVSSSVRPSATWSRHGPTIRRAGTSSGVTVSSPCHDANAAPAFRLAGGSLDRHALGAGGQLQRVELAYDYSIRVHRENVLSPPTHATQGFPVQLPGGIVAKPSDANAATACTFTRAARRGSWQLHRRSPQRRRGHGNGRRRRLRRTATRSRSC
jgi:hypothetical protein